MATITNTNAVNFVLYTKNDFKTTGVQSYESTGDIVFVEKENSIYLNGTYYGISDEEKKAITDLTAGLDAVDKRVGSNVALTTSLIEIVNRLRNSIDGNDITSGLPQGTPTLWTKTGVLENADNIVAAIDALASKVNELNTNGGNYITKGTVTNANIGTGTITINSAQDIVDTIDKVIGTGENVWTAGEAKTLTKLRELIKVNTEAINTLTGGDNDGASLTEILGEIQKIKTELESGEGTGLTTLIDGLKVFLTGLTTSGASFTVGGQSYNTLQAILNALEGKISEAKTAADSATQATDKIGETIQTEIAKLDATVRGNLETNDSISSGKHVGVKVVEEDGKLTSVLVVEDDIASAKTVTELSSTVNTMQSTVNNLTSALKWTVIS